MLAFVLTISALLIAELAVRNWREWSGRNRAVAMTATAGALGAAVASLPNMLYVGKVLGRLAMPTGIIWGLLIVAMLYGWHRRKLRETAVLGVFFVLYSVAGNPALGGAMFHWLESDFADVNPTAGDDLEAVFVLGGGTSAPPIPDRRPGLAQSGQRILTAARVFHARNLETMVVSGSSIPGLGLERSVAAEGATILGELGVPEAAIVQLHEPKNTSQEVRAYKQLADEKGWTRIGVVSSAWHLRRVMKLCSANGLDAEPLPADVRGSLEWNGLLSVIPDGGGFSSVQKASWEILGAAVGR